MPPTNSIPGWKKSIHSKHGTRPSLHLNIWRRSCRAVLQWHLHLRLSDRSPQPAPFLLFAGISLVAHEPIRFNIRSIQNKSESGLEVTQPSTVGLAEATVIETWSHVSCAPGSQAASCCKTVSFFCISFNALQGFVTNMIVKGSRKGSSVLTFMWHQLALYSKGEKKMIRTPLWAAPCILTGWWSCLDPATLRKKNPAQERGTASKIEQKKRQPRAFCYWDFENPLHAQTCGSDCF